MRLDHKSEYSDKNWTLPKAAEIAEFTTWFFLHLLFFSLLEIYTDTFSTRSYTSISDVPFWDDHIWKPERVTFVFTVCPSPTYHAPNHITKDDTSPSTAWCHFFLVAQATNNIQACQTSSAHPPKPGDAHIQWTDGAQFAMWSPKIQKVMTPPIRASTPTAMQNSHLPCPTKIAPTTMALSLGCSVSRA